MKNRYWGSLSALLCGLLGSAEGCSSGRTVCELICECSHCNDFDQDLVCLQYETREAQSEAYDCSAQWEAHMSCIQEKGTCDEKKSRYVTRGSSSCSDMQDIGVTCMTQADCDAFGSPDSITCTANSCMARICSGNGNSCTSDADCSGDGAELCAEEEEAVSKCIEAASDTGAK